jgi:L-lactate dehydrogenase complex protein LldG
MQESTHRESRNQVIRNIRKALIHKTNNRFRGLDQDQNLFVPVEDALEEAFAKSFSAIGGQFLFCEDELEFGEKLLSLAELHHWKKILCWEPSIVTLLEKFEFPYSASTADFEDGIAGITSCEALVARTGSILVSSALASGRRLPVIPTSHLVLAYTSQLVADIGDGLSRIRQRYPDGLPSMIGTITGPSRTADIEKTLVTPAHGPRDVVVFLLDDTGTGQP